MGGTSMSLRVPDDVRVEFEVEVDGDEIEVEIELKWSTSSAAGRAEPAPEESSAEAKEHGGALQRQAEPTRLSPDRGSGEDWPPPIAGRSNRCRRRVQPGER